MQKYLAVAPQDVLAPFAREGVVKVRMWLRVPRAAADLQPASLDVDQHLIHGYMPVIGRPKPTPARVTRRFRRSADEEEGG